VAPGRSRRGRDRRSPLDAITSGPRLGIGPRLGGHRLLGVSEDRQGSTPQAVRLARKTGSGPAPGRAIPTRVAKGAERVWRVPKATRRDEGCRGRPGRRSMRRPHSSRGVGGLRRIPPTPEAARRRADSDRGAHGESFGGGAQRGTQRPGRVSIDQKSLALITGVRSGPARRRLRPASVHLALHQVQKCGGYPCLIEGQPDAPHQRLMSDRWSFLTSP